MSEGGDVLKEKPVALCSASCGFLCGVHGRGDPRLIPSLAWSMGNLCYGSMPDLACCIPALVVGNGVGLSLAQVAASQVIWVLLPVLVMGLYPRIIITARTSGGHTISSPMPARPRCLSPSVVFDPLSLCDLCFPLMPLRSNKSPQFRGR